MKSGNRSLFLDKISSKSPFICPQIWPCSMKCMAFICDLQLVFQMVHNLHSENMIFSVDNDDTMDQLKQVQQRSSSEAVPDIRNGMKIFSPVSGWMMACVQRAWKLPHAASSPETWMYERVVNVGRLTSDIILTCLIFCASHSWTCEQCNKTKEL